MSSAFTHAMHVCDLAASTYVDDIIVATLTGMEEDDFQLTSLLFGLIRQPLGADKDQKQPHVIGIDKIFERTRTQGNASRIGSQKP
jgi:hypothetical protein|tara:strand:+ start:468 stop:725 length:258 start_codon:yes stop_codon:yes gene_type:complete